MKAVVLTNDQPNQAALVNRLSRVIDIAAVVVSRNIPKNRPSISRRIRSISNRLAGRTVGREFVHTWQELVDHYAQKGLSRDAESPKVNVDNVNDQTTVDLIAANSPCLVIVSGTNLVGRKVIAAAATGFGIVNLHTGISPYVKGGPNCTNWCLSKGWFHLIGNTVMWLDLGIDSGNIIATERTVLDGSESLFELHLKVMEHAHDLYCRAVERIALGAKVPSVPQYEIAEGTDFYSAEWDQRAIKSARSNFEKRYKGYFSKAAGQGVREPDIRLISLNDV